MGALTLQMALLYMASGSLKLGSVMGMLRYYARNASAQTSQLPCTWKQALHAMVTLARNDLGSIVEACDSALPFLVGLLQDWADAGAPAMHVRLCTASTCLITQWAT